MNNLPPRVVSYGFENFEQYSAVQSLPSAAKPPVSAEARQVQVRSKELDRSLLALFDRSRPAAPAQQNPPAKETAQKENIPPKPAPADRPEQKPAPEPPKPADPPQKEAPKSPAPPEPPKEVRPAPAVPPRPRTSEIGVQTGPQPEPAKNEAVPANQESLREAQELLKRLHEEEKQQLDERNRELARKNQDLKNANGRLGIAHFLNALELLRLEEPKRQAAAQPAPLQELPQSRPEDAEEIRRLATANQLLESANDGLLRANQQLQKDNAALRDRANLLEQTQLELANREKPAPAPTKTQETQTLPQAQPQAPENSQKPQPVPAAQDAQAAEENERLKKENRQLRDRANELGALRQELDELREKLRYYEERSFERPEESSRLEQPRLDQLSRDNAKLKKELQEVKEAFKRERDRIELMSDKERRVISTQDYELKRLAAENDSLRRSLIETEKAYSAEVSNLNAKLAKRDLSRRELQGLLQELEGYKADQEYKNQERALKHEEAASQNKHLKRELEKVADELESLRKMYLDQSRKLSSLKTAQQTRPQTRHSPEKQAPADARPAPPRPETAQVPPIERFLLGLELVRLNFAYAGCRCGKLHASVERLERSRSPERRAAQSPGSSLRAAPDGLEKPPAASAEVAALLRERDNLRTALADYQRKLLDTKRQLDNHLNARFAQSEPETGQGFGRELAAQDLQSRVRLLTAENARLQRQLDLRPRPPPAGQPEPVEPRRPVRKP